MTANVQHDRSQTNAFRSRLLYVFFGILLMFLLLTLALDVHAQKDGEVIKVDTELVSFEISATDTNGNPVDGLSLADLIVRENGIDRKIDFFQPLYDETQKRPLVIVFALDVSGSMTEKEIERLRTALTEFIERLSASNAYFALTTFSMDVKTIRSFTNRPADIRKAFDKISKQRFGLSTHAYDAVDHAIRYIDKRGPKAIRGKLPKKAVVVISDGFPVGDIVSPRIVIERAQIADTSVYSVIMPSYSRLQGNRKPLITPFEASGLMEKTGGKSLYANEESLEPLFRSLAERISSSYVVAFYPDEAADDKTFHKVEILSAKGHTIKQNRMGYTPKQ